MSRDRAVRNCNAALTLLLGTPLASPELNQSLLSLPNEVVNVCDLDVGEEAVRQWMVLPALDPIPLLNCSALIRGDLFEVKVEHLTECGPFRFGEVDVDPAVHVSLHLARPGPRLGDGVKRSRDWGIPTPADLCAVESAGFEFSCFDACQGRSPGEEAEQSSVCASAVPNTTFGQF